MINSVDEYAAGQDYDIDEETGDRFILAGYADGALSRAYNEKERSERNADNQVVDLGGLALEGAQ